MRFSASSGQSYTLKQARSTWDSKAVKEYVAKKADGKYIDTPETQKGITIYTYGGNAAWVNAGILYTIEGDANLTSTQIRRIATSM